MTRPLNYSIILILETLERLYMTKDLIIEDGFSLADLSAELGAGTEKEQGARMPLLKMNRRIKDDNKNMLPLGAFYLTGQDKEAFCVSDAENPCVTIRALSHHFQYSHYDSKSEKYISRSLQIPNFRTEARDTVGTLRCGKPDGKAMQQLTSDERAKYKEIKNTRLVRALVTMTGKTADGETVNYTNEPCLIKLTGQNNFAQKDGGVYARFDAQVRDLIPRGYDLWQFDLKVHSDEHTSPDGSLFWYTMEYSFNPKDPQKLDQKLVDSLKHVAETVREENAEVDRLYKAAVMDSVASAGAMTALGDDLEADFENAF